MDYDKELKDIERLVAQGLHAQAVRTAGGVLEQLYKDLYRELVGRLPPAERTAVSQEEQKIGRGKGIDEFTLGMSMGLFRQAGLVAKLEKHLGLALPFMRSFEPNYFRELRNRVTHDAAQVSVEEAQLLLGQLRMLLKEAGRLVPPPAPPPPSAATMLKPWTQVVTPHDDIRTGELSMDTYAADLWAVARQDPMCPAVYRDPRAFFEATYPTAALKALLGDVMGVLAGGRSDRVLQLRTPFGGGKTHTLIALYHLARARASLKDVAWADLPNPGGVRVAVIQGLALDPQAPRRVEGGLQLNTLWGELAWQIGGAAGYARVEAQDRARTAPGGDVLRELLGGAPALILMDEVLVYVQRAGGFPVHDSTLGRQTMVFLQALTETVRALPHAALVYSLQASVREAAGDEALLDELDHLVSRIDAKREPVSGDEVMRVVQRRLFNDLGDEAVRRQVAREYGGLYRRLREGIAETEADRREAGHEAEVLEQRILASYPFHPDLLDLMYHRWGSLPSYQRTRGALQFLATVVHALWHDGGGAQPLVGPGDVSLADEEVRGAFFSQVGEREHFTAVLDADLTGAPAKVREVDQRVASESPALRHLRVGTRLGTATFMYSFGARTGEDQGVLENELIASCLAPGLDRMVLSATLGDLRKNLLYLHHTSGRYLFKTEPNLNKLIGDESGKFSAKDVLDCIEGALDAQLKSGGRGAVRWPVDSAAIPDHEPVFRVVYLRLDWAAKEGEVLERDLRAWLENRGSGKREYLNALAFAVPSREQGDLARQSARQLLAIGSLLKQKSKYRFSNEQLAELMELRDGAAGVLDAALGQLYEQVYFPAPNREGDAAYQMEMINLRARVSSVREIHGRILDVLRMHVFDYVTPGKLVSLTRLGQDAEYLSCEKIVPWFFSYLDFPKLLSTYALQKSVAQGVEDETFGYVAGAWEADGELVVDDARRRVRFGDRLDPTEVDLSRSAYLLAPDLARRLTAPVVIDEPAGTGETGGAPAVDIQTQPGDAGASQEPDAGGRRYRLRVTADKSQAFMVFKVLQNLSDRADRLVVTFDIEAETEAGFDPVWLRNAVEEPLDEADIRKA
ncbi:MAG: ATP-binding protein [Anaerolineae bacterium]|nr:ATP-binding protein [Anaerolineae bacterium]